ncbi:MAG: ribbon-helix-helix protein, CopG family [Candidatus Thiodiazotropha sp. 6PLUC4]
MSTTTIRLPTELKDRLAKVAKNLGSTSHALILDAIAERIDAEEHRIVSAISVLESNPYIGRETT